MVYRNVLIIDNVDLFVSMLGMFGIRLHNTTTLSVIDILMIILKRTSGHLKVLIAIRTLLHPPV